MQVIDDRGRLFGVVNVIDALVVLLLLAVVAAGIALVMAPAPAPEPTPTTVEYRVNAPTYVTAHIEPGLETDDYRVTEIEVVGTYEHRGETYRVLDVVIVHADDPGVTIGETRVFEFETVVFRGTVTG